MAIPEKRALGAGLLWCGVMILPCLAMAYMTRAKVARASTSNSQTQNDRARAATLDTNSTSARTRAQFIELDGKSAYFAHDVAKDFIVVV